jgi:hypothetical protein
MSSVSLNRPSPSTCFPTRTPLHSHATDACTQTLLKEAAEAQEEAQQKKKQAHHQLNSVEMPFSVALGFVIYQAGVLMDPSRSVMTRFEKLLKKNQELRATVSNINTALVRDQGAVPPKLRLPLSQLQSLLHANDTAPSTMYPYMDTIRQMANGAEPKVQHLARQVAEYQGILQTLMHDKQGFMMLAREPRVRRFMKASKQQAYNLARGNRERFFVKMFGRGLADDSQLGVYQKMFQQLGESHRLKIRLLAFGVPALLFGYFFSKVTMADKATHQ